MRPMALKRLMMMMKGLNYFKQNQWRIQGRGIGPPPPLFWVQKEEMTEEKKASRASKSRSPPLPPRYKYKFKLKIRDSDW